ncbi:hypothetical protein N7490_005885 [Penicillium lividum]|nr:hypothetical protein N7490_005885 [Penicillium lividum]
MNSASFGNENTNSGFQVGFNNGVINVTPEVLRSLAFPQMLDRRDNIEPCHTNTCEWILNLEKYGSWKRQPCGLLWIKGKPGAGKSTLMAFLYDKVRLPDRTQGIWLDFFFTARGTEMQRTPLGMFRSLLNQIFYRDVTVRPRIREIYEQRCRQFGHGERQWEWPQLVLKELLTGAILEPAIQQPVTIFVDALDEAGAESAQRLAAYFHRLTDLAEKKKLPIRTCISCRHYPIVGNAQTMEIHVEHHNHQDISTYVKDIITDTEIGEGLGQERTERLTEQLIQQANGIFQWVHLIMPLIQQRMREGESFGEIHYWLRDIPADLEEIYTYILKNVIEDRNRGQSLIFFQWVCLAERPLTVKEMRYALVTNNATMTPSPIMIWEKTDGFVGSDERMKLRTKALSGGLTEIQVAHRWAKIYNIWWGLFDEACPAKETTLLHIAAATNLVDIMDSILSDRSDVAKKDGNGNTAFYLAARHGHIAAGKILLEKGADREAGGKDEMTPLKAAASFGHVEFVQWLLCDEMGYQKDEIEGALLAAAAGGHQNMVEILIGAGADPNSQDGAYGNALQAAAFGKSIEIVQILIGAGADVNAQGGHYGNSLQAAAYNGDTRVVRMLLDAHADVNAQGGYHGSALQAAAVRKRRSHELMHILIRAGLDVCTLRGIHDNAIQAARIRESTEIVQILIKAGADVNTQSGYYGNALQAAAFEGDTEVMRMLLNAHADVNAKGGFYGNALQAAASSYKSNTEIVGILLDAHADVNAQGGYYGNALQAAAYEGATEVMRMLLNAHADVNAKGGFYGNALQAAASSYKSNTEIVGILLDAHADVNAQGGYYGNALRAATLQERGTEIMQMLIDAHADVSAQDIHPFNIDWIVRESDIRAPPPKAIIQLPALKLKPLHLHHIEIQPTMSWSQKTFTLPRSKRGSYLITDHVLSELPEIRDYKVGMLTLFVQHTSCALSLNENWDKLVRADMSDALDRIVPSDWDYRHDAEGEDDMPAHIKSALIGASVNVPISDGRLATGTWQGIWYLEFRTSPHTRNVVATIQGQKMK